MITKNFKVTIDSKEVEFTVKSPTLQNQRDAQKVYNQTFTDAVRSKCVVRAKLDDLLKEQGLWNETKQAVFNALQKELSEGEKKLAKGGFNLSVAKILALRMRVVRDEIKDLISVRTSLDNHSAEGQADNSRFNFLVSACVVYKDTDQPYFSSMEDYLNRADDQVAVVGAQNLANMLYGLDNDFEKNLPENRFLSKFKFVDTKLRLINKEGHLVNEDGKLINEFGRFVDQNGNFIDKDGNRVDEEGEYILDAKPFLDDDGKPIILDEDKETKNEIIVKSPEPVVVEPKADDTE